MHNELVITQDGSPTFYSHKYKDHYHSTHGALAESVHIYINAGLKRVCETKSVVRILEMGFGTGLNVLLTVLYTDTPGVLSHTRCVSNLHRVELPGNEMCELTELPRGRIAGEKSFPGDVDQSLPGGKIIGEKSLPRGVITIEYISVESDPLTENEVRSLTYVEQIPDNRARALFDAIHSAPWDVPGALSENFLLTKRRTRLEDFQSQAKFDLIYYDAFSPSVQPQLWDEAMFAKIASMCAPEAVLVTYSSRGSVRRALSAAGFSVTKLPGPKGKREMVVAVLA